MASIRDTIIGAIITALNAANPAGVPDATRVRLAPLDPSELPAIIVRPVREEVAGIGRTMADYDQRTLEIAVDCYATGSTPDQILDVMLAWVTSILNRSKPATNANCTETGTSWEFEESDRTYSKATVSFKIDYHTPATSQERTA